MSRENSPRHGSFRRNLNSRDPSGGAAGTGSGSGTGSGPGSPHHQQSNHHHHQQQHYHHHHQPPIMEHAGAPISTSASNIATVLEDGETAHLPPLTGSGPSRQRSLRDRLKDGITGSFSWQ
ncbi:GS homeobox 2-like [Drosophila ficusphila]|uniref:GS homeobox 2-like n=1 Tax=Drosophila ficusphila TaxID=30025 RepID=UPI0007E5FF6C|nr:GS homeobox 2-like [Drosophila ficusphila]XP_017044113.1 GS homeobox 2-like [Drosophila ficusphila]XP_017044114.1 GS homeobox 2-like [Drosophila ficusphila]